MVGPITYSAPGGLRGHSEVCMDLQRNDWVKTESGETGEIVHISRLTVFVAIRAVDKEDRIEAYLASQLTKVDRPKHP
jgi:hypothetical protein